MCEGSVSIRALRCGPETMKMIQRFSGERMEGWIQTATAIHGGLSLSLIHIFWQEMGWGSIIYFATLSGVDRSLLEAAEIDGANRFQKIWYINVPVLIPTIIILLILQCGSLLSVGYEKVYLLQNTTNLSGSEVISTYV